MARFWLWITLFCGYWLFILIQFDSFSSVSVLFFAVTLALWFLMFLKRYQLVLFMSLGVLIFIHGIIFPSIRLHTLLFLILLLIMVAENLVKTSLYMYMGLHLCFSFLLNIHEVMSWPVWVVIHGVIYYGLIQFDRYKRERLRYTEKYEQLFSNYRKMKRSHLENEKSARLEERTRIARDIHDSVGHKLTALMMTLEMLAIKEKNDTYRHLKQMATESLEETRQAVQALNEEEHGGISAVIELIRKLEAESHIEVQFTLKRGVLLLSLSNQVSVGLYRIVQEALTNAMRHANARQVEIILSTTADGHVAFNISNPVYHHEPWEFGFGLKNMVKRVQSLKGNIDILRTSDAFIVKGMLPSRKGEV